MEQNSKFNCLMETCYCFKNGASLKSLIGRKISNIGMKIFFKFSIISLFIGLILTSCSKTPVENDNTSNEEQNFYEDCTDGSQVVEIEYMGEKISCNYVNGRYIIEGDIVIKDDNTYVDIDSDDTNIQSSSILRAAKALNTQPWLEGKVYYDYTATPLSLALISEIEVAMKKISSVTNLKFILLQTKEARMYRANRRIIFKANNIENSSERGMQNKYQVLLLVEGNKAALHEICHAIGLMHEAQRGDRDNYIKIFKENILEDKINQIEDRYLTELRSPELDLGSIMMYNMYAFTKNGQATIKTISGRPYVAQRDSLSFWDKYIINKMYPSKDASPDIIIHENNIKRTTNSCELTGELIYAGEPPIAHYGICYREKGAATSYIDGVSYTNINKEGIYTCQLTDLKPNTLYEARAFVIQKGGQRIPSDNFAEFKTEQEENTAGVLINGVRWATRNLGAQNPEDYGGYYQWNRGTTGSLSQEDYYNLGYANTNSWLRVNDPCPKGWRVPTYEELKAAFDMKYSGSILNGVSGLFVSGGSGNTGIFMPAGAYWSATRGRMGSMGGAEYLSIPTNYWTSIGYYTRLPYETALVRCVCETQ